MSGKAGFMHFQVPDSDLMRGRCPCSAHRSNSIAAQPKSVSDSPAKIEPVAREARAEAATKISAGRGVSQKRYGEPQNNSFVAIHRPTKEPIRSIFHQGLLNREQGWSVQQCAQANSSHHRRRPRCSPSSHRGKLLAACHGRGTRSK